MLAIFTSAHVVALFMQTCKIDSELSPHEVETQVDSLLTGPFASLAPERRKIIDEIMSRIKVRIDEAIILENAEDHEEWLAEVDREQWRLWPRLERYLTGNGKLSPVVIQELNRSTDQALKRLESPQREGRWDRRGMVVGHVQSGKTTHYTALAAKAIDAGYELVIILAGIHKSLRSQTHERIDEQLIGRDSASLFKALREKRQYFDFIGVGKQSHEHGDTKLPFDVIPCTTSIDDGDFSLPAAQGLRLQPGPTTRLVMVVKKNGRILGNLIHWLRTLNTTPGINGSQNRIRVPALVIDDEADHASVNTNPDPDERPTTINSRIRELLMSFDRVGFVGYTATPFANIFISSETQNDEYGPDLFPSSFIVNLQPPSNYLGPTAIFGHPGDESANLPEQLPLPMWVNVEDSGTWLPDKHKTTQHPGPLPNSLKEAIKLFVLNCAVRAWRGDGDKHNSMLVHATRFLSVQARINTQIHDELFAIREIVAMGAHANSDAIEASFKQVWLDRIVCKHGEFKDRLGDQCQPLPTWKELWKQVQVILPKITIMQINGESTDALTYSKSPEGLHVIAIGGDKLSRGLTLEGLSVSYFLRASAMYDTLMQMGRWFGYRPRYSDLCRVYTPKELYSAFREIALATEELRLELDYMGKINATPREYGLRVRTPSDGLLITARNKLRTGEKIAVRFAGQLVQALMIPRGETGQAQVNRDAARRLIESLGPASRDVRGKSSSHFIWHGVDVTKVNDFLSQYEAFSTPSFFKRCEALRDYISQMNQKNELTKWTVAVISKAPSKDPSIVTPEVQIGSHKIHLVTRTPKDDSPADRFDTQVVVGSADEAVDMNVAEWDQVVAMNDDAVEKPRGLQRLLVRKVRPEQRGLLMLYLVKDDKDDRPNMFIPIPALSFPTSDKAEAVSYTVGEVWRRQYGFIYEQDEDDDAQ